MSSRERLLRKIEAEIAAGRLWRAREILASVVSQHISDAVVLERYGFILDQLGDKLEAGRFYFLSGVRKAAYAESIEIFRSRAMRHGTANLLAQLPAAAKRAGLDTLPAVAVAELRELGVSESELRRRHPPAKPPQQPTVLKSWVAGLILATFGLIFVAGILTIGGWLIRLAFWLWG